MSRRSPILLAALIAPALGAALPGAALSGALLLGAPWLGASPLAAQAVAYGEPPPPAGAATRSIPGGSASTRAAETTSPLADRYRIRLVSAWPQLPAGAGCENGGTETVEGTLTRTGGDEYSGTLTRTTHLLFCGAHGADGEACALTLDGRGGVAVLGVVVADERAPAGRGIRLAWTPDAAHGATVRGECAADFKAKVERMYLTVRHGVEFGLPNNGAAPRRERLEDYAWVVEVE